MVAVAAVKERTDALAEFLRGDLEEMREGGLSFRAMAQELTRRHYTPPRGGAWHPSTVYRLLQW